MAMRYSKVGVPWKTTELVMVRWNQYKIQFHCSKPGNSSW